ncbi:MAG: hypothetical protein R2705_06355 [Ilumatobacteraceae bacterium]
MVASVLLGLARQVAKGRMESADADEIGRISRRRTTWASSPTVIW